MTDKTYAKILKEAYIKTLESEINYYQNQIKEYRQRIEEAAIFVDKNLALLGSIERKSND